MSDDAVPVPSILDVCQTIFCLSDEDDSCDVLVCRCPCHTHELRAEMTTPRRLVPRLVPGEPLARGVPAILEEG